MVADQGVLPVREEVVCPKDGNVKNQTCIQVVTQNLNKKFMHSLYLGLMSKAITKIMVSKK